MSEHEIGVVMHNRRIGLGTKSVEDDVSVWYGVSHGISGEELVIDLWGWLLGVQDSGRQHWLYRLLCHLQDSER